MNSCRADEIVLNESASQPEKPNQMLQNNQNEEWTKQKLKLNLVIIA